ncbi:alcohol dehydrogenase catalytic domain-containing protein [Shinella sp. AETb1-6]|uniref:zinc-dependent dehydrogenase n=1 Tax=Shinella sp. AETb1-6 TaxID=2692210 RepID=UPI00136D49D2|nr:zinc-dependent dehydrogenase [Shinella sp. AETb1-6]MXN54345.1 alcohol dehydrogenase catalytic domain-containing protein [Shinella sp. AETb1-6]
MKAGLLKAPNELLFQTVADPVLSTGDLLIRIKAATVCGTDIRIFRGRKTAGVRYPSILGHEFAGEVVENGGHSNFSCGDAVAVCPAIPCGYCDYCKRGYENICQNLTAIGYEIDGAFAEYIRIPARAVEAHNVFKIPANLSWEKAALVEPLSCVLNGQEKISVEVGDSVVILGSGPIGLLHVKLARHSGAAKIIVSEPSASRREAAIAAGADIVVDPVNEDLNSIVRQHTKGLGADKLIVAIGVTKLANDALSLVRHRGKISLFAGFSSTDMATMDVNLIHYNELVVTGSFGLNRLQFEKSLDMIAAGQIEVDSMLTHRFELKDIGAALETAEKGSAVKVAVVNP